MTAPATRGRARRKLVPEMDTGRCMLAVQAKVRGYQDLRVYGQTAEVTGTGHGAISIKVGQVILVLEDRAAMFSWVAAIQRAIELQDGAYGPEMPPARLGQQAS